MENDLPCPKYCCGDFSEILEIRESFETLCLKALIWSFLGAEWLKGEGNAGTRKVTAFYPESDSSANGKPSTRELMIPSEVMPNAVSYYLRKKMSAKNCRERNNSNNSCQFCNWAALNSPYYHFEIPDCVCLHESFQENASDLASLVCVCFMSASVTVQYLFLCAQKFRVEMMARLVSQY